jgi:16S rRNA processing protein RimM
MGLTAKMPADLVVVGHITGAYGVHGWIKVHPYSVEASALLHAKTWWLTESTIANPPCDVEKLEAKLHGDGLVAKLMGIVDRTAAQALKGRVVQIQRSHFPVLDEGEFYWSDLIGLTVENQQGESLGVVTELMDNGAHSILRVVKKTAPEQKAGKAVSEWEYLIPFVKQFVLGVDDKNKKIIVDWDLEYR